MNNQSSHTIYVGNIQSIDDDTLREYFQRFGEIEALFHNGARAADEWLIDYRFIRFSSGTDINIFVSHKIDHTICRIRLDIHSYDAAFLDETRFTSDRKICIAHTNPKLDRNLVKKAFTRYGRILNCTCVSSGNGVEYVYIEFDSINPIRSIFSSGGGQRHCAGRTSLAVKQALRPSQVAVKMESSIPLDYQRKDDVKLFSSSSRESPAIPSDPPNFNDGEATNRVSTTLASSEQLKELERDYGMIIRQDFDEITYQIEKYLQEQRYLYKKRQAVLLDRRS